MPELTCINCRNTFNGRANAKYCSAKCRVQAGRNRNINVTEPAPDVTLTPPTVTLTELSPTDQLFQQDAIDRGLGKDWLRFTTTRKGKCLNCAHTYTTTLSLLRYCSPTCRTQAT